MKHHLIRSPQVLNIFEIPNYRILPPLVLLQIPSPLRGDGICSISNYKKNIPVGDVLYKKGNYQEHPVGMFLIVL